ncbi:MAG TPA: hypothetical protein VJS17_10580 [Pyrinomonadaceae bacterium]|nr:hypothetical protein [Pyrinomonadaceae bacterium]
MSSYPHTGDTLHIMSANVIGRLLVAAILLSALAAVPVLAQQTAEPKPAGVPVLWRNPGDISRRNLTFGPGSTDLAPVAPFTFLKEEQTGESPKFDVTDARGETWVVKVGPEAQAETVASRLIWSVGYFADEAYYVDRAEIKDLPKLTRGQEFIENRSVVRGARFEPKRKNISRGANWDWEVNPFLKTRELDGLKVLMVLLANYDTSLRNNRVLGTNNSETGELEARYVATDVGATLGKVGGLGGKRSKNTLEDFRSSKFILGVENGLVKFDYDTTPKKMGVFASIFKPSYRSSQERKERVMQNISVENARWIGSLLTELSDEQIRDAFRAANYDQKTMDGFVVVIRERINQLNNLSAPVAASK